LLLLRAVLGIAVLLEGGFYIWGSSPTPAAWFVGCGAFVAGAMLLFGLLTPVVGAMVGVGALGVALSLFPVCTPSVFDSKASLIFGVTMLLTVVSLGPGRFSVDARVFGRREIIIPPRTR